MHVRVGLEFVTRSLMENILLLRNDASLGSLLPIPWPTICTLHNYQKLPITSYTNNLSYRHEKSAFVFPRQRLRVQKCSPEHVKLSFPKIATNMCKPGFVIKFH